MGGALNPRVVLWHKGPNLHRYTLLRCFVFLLNISKSQHVTWDEQDEPKWEKVTKRKYVGPGGGGFGHCYHSWLFGIWRKGKGVKACIIYVIRLYFFRLLAYIEMYVYIYFKLDE